MAGAQRTAQPADSNIRLGRSMFERLAAWSYRRRWLALAALLNVLSVGASMGVITLVLQEGGFGVQQGLPYRGISSCHDFRHCVRALDGL